MEKRFFTALLIAVILILTGCKPPVKTYSMKADITFQAGTDAGTLNNVAAILKKRMLTFGLKERSVKSEVSGSTIHISLSGVTDTLRVKRLLTAPGHLEFRKTYDNGEVQAFLAKADRYLIGHPESIIRDRDADGVSGIAEQGDITKIESLRPDSLLTVEEWAARHPLYGRLRPDVGSDGVPVRGSITGFALIKDTAVINTYLRMKEIRAFMPADLRFVWNKNPARYFVSDTLYELHAIKLSGRDDRAVLDDSAVESAVSESDKRHPIPVVRINMNSSGAEVWSRLTNDNIDRCIAIIMDGYVVSSPRVIDGIKGGRSEISAGFSTEEASDLANIINSGRLPAGYDRFVYSVVSE